MVAYDGRMRIANAVRVLGITVLAGAACIRPGAETCADGSACAEGSVCVALATPATNLCATPEQLRACEGVADGVTCMLGASAGTCFGGACVAAACGDGLVDADPTREACDDGNQVSGDGCAADCKSAEACGNGHVDLATGEQCDDGHASLSGDGCSAQCKLEYRLWRNVQPEPPALRTGFGLVTDPLYGVLLFGGGETKTVGVPPTVVHVAAFFDTWRWDGTSWLELASPTPVPRRMDMAMAYDAARRRVVVFGGYNSVNQLQAETSEWDGVTWRKRDVVVHPTQRAGASMACRPDGCVLFGGVTSGAGAVTNEAWKWDGTAWTQLQLPTPRPSARAYASAAYDPVRNVITVFGGEDATGTKLFDTWALGTTWTLENPGVSGPRPTVPPSIAWDPAARAVFQVAEGKTWKYDGATWAQVAAPLATLPHPQLAWDNDAGTMIALGPTAASDAWLTFERQGATWTQTLERRPVGGTKEIAAAYDARRGLTVVLDTAGTWEWNGVGWHRRLASAATPYRPGVGVAYHAACGVTISVGGGSVTGGTSAETLRYEQQAPLGVSWIPVTNIPASRTRHAMAYDSRRERVIVFGGGAGNSADNLLGDLWELSAGTGCEPTAWTWHAITPAGAAPSARVSAGMAYDAARGVTVLFGGMNAAGELLDDTWEWDGTAWRERTPTTRPSARFEHALAYDPRRGRVIAFAGKPKDGRTNDAWEWDGTTWTELAPAILPPARSGMTLAPDLTGGLLALGGDGLGGQGTLDLVRLTSELSTSPPEACADATTDLDQDGLAGCADPDCWGRCAPLCTPGESCNGPRCGDGTCSAVEDYVLCAADCAPP